jgi:hypothetical protein
MNKLMSLALVAGLAPAVFAVGPTYHTYGTHCSVLVPAFAHIYAPVGLTVSQDDPINFGKLVVIDPDKEAKVGLNEHGKYNWHQFKNIVPLEGKGGDPCIAYIKGTKDPSLRVCFSYKTWMTKHAKLEIESPKTLKNERKDKFEIPLFGTLELKRHTLGRVEGVVLVTARYL